MTFARWGIPTLLTVSAVLGWGVWLLPPGGPRTVGLVVAALLWLFTLAFFRNPARRPLGDGRSLVAPADGVVADIGEVEEGEFIGGRALRIGIFLSVFDVHVNRSPVAGTIRYARYKPGQFLDARHPDVSHENEANTLGIEVDPAVAPGLKLLVRQLSGLIARRIICTHGVGDALTRGELFGMIKFGSRTELWLPADCPHRVLVARGQRVRCGETVLVELLDRQLAGVPAGALAPPGPAAAGRPR
jgi:phosphatidylserine decarboxylase